ncbi:XkdX family protein [Faecalimicrobium sp. JNUCC 81]
MNWFEKVKRYYEKGIYTSNQVKIFVKSKKITEKEYKEIIGEGYIA